MINNIEPFLLNVLFLIFFIVFIPMFIERSNNTLSKAQKLWIKIIAANIGIISCMAFPLFLDGGFVFDLRVIAVLVSGLYGGVPAAIVAWVVTNMYSLSIGGYGLYSNLIVSTIVLILCLSFTVKFNQGSKKKKLSIAATLSLVTGLLVLFVLIVLFSVNITPFIGVAYLTLIVMSTVGMIFVLEIMREDAYIKKRVIKAEKMDIVSHLASSISHEVRNPLTVVKGFLQLMESTDLPPEKRKDFIELSIKEINRANDIIKNYLTFAKPELENVELVNIENELKNAVEIITPLANLNCVKIETKIDTFMIKSDPQLLQQCLLNITKNCIEAMPDSGKLMVKTSEDNDYVVIQITDNGVGMTEEQLARIGEPYYTTKGREGTGLGMLAVFQIIEMMNGKINVSSKLDEGTTFTIRLPIAVSDDKEVENNTVKLSS